MQLRTFTDEQRAWRVETERRLVQLEATRARALPNRLGVVALAAIVVLLCGLLFALR